MALHGMESDEKIQDNIGMIHGTRPSNFNPVKKHGDSDSKNNISIGCSQALFHNIRILLRAY